MPCSSCLSKKRIKCMVRFFLKFSKDPWPLSCRCPEPRVGLLETPPCWHATIYWFFPMIGVCVQPGFGQYNRRFIHSREHDARGPTLWRPPPPLDPSRFANIKPFILIGICVQSGVGQYNWRLIHSREHDAWSPTFWRHPHPTQCDKTTCQETFTTNILVGWNQVTWYCQTASGTKLFIGRGTSDSASIPTIPNQVSLQSNSFFEPYTKFECVSRYQIMGLYERVAQE